MTRLTPDRLERVSCSPFPVTQIAAPESQGLKCRSTVMAQGGKGLGYERMLSDKGLTGNFCYQAVTRFEGF